MWGHSSFRGSHFENNSLTNKIVNPPIVKPPIVEPQTTMWEWMCWIPRMGPFWKWGSSLRRQEPWVGPHFLGQLHSRSSVLTWHKDILEFSNVKVFMHRLRGDQPYGYRGTLPSIGRILSLLVGVRCIANMSHYSWI